MLDQASTLATPLRMIDIITVCTYDARKIAGDLVRLLEAEQHHVQLIFGRQVLGEIETIKTSHAAIIMIWSEDAPSQSYMRECLRQVEPTRLVEIATALGWPDRKDRKSPVIEFKGWRGERGGRAWNGLNERLRAVTRVLEPPKPPARHAALALGLASVAAVGVAMGVRLNQQPVLAPPSPETQQTAELEAPTESVGGATYTLEPASVEDLSSIPPLRTLRTPAIELPPIELTEYNPEPLPEVRDPTLFERLREFNPLFSNASDEED